MPDILVVGLVALVAGLVGFGIALLVRRSFALSSETASRANAENGCRKDESDRVAAHAKLAPLRDDDPRTRGRRLELGPNGPPFDVGNIPPPLSPKQSPG